MKNSNMVIAGIVIVLLVGGLVVYNSRSASDVMEDASDNVMMEEEVMMKDEETEKMMMETEIGEDVMMKEINDAMLQDMMTMDYQYSGELIDVSGGTASGIAQANYDEAYSLYVAFKNLPDLEEGLFYEGWVVRMEPFDVISTGPLSDGVNTYSSGENLTDHDFYVLTLEPDDGDPAPATHILEGTMKMVAQ